MTQCYCGIELECYRAFDREWMYTYERDDIISITWTSSTEKFDILYDHQML